MPRRLLIPLLLLILLPVLAIAGFGWQALQNRQALWDQQQQQLLQAQLDAIDSQVRGWLDQLAAGLQPLPDADPTALRRWRDRNGHVEQLLVLDADGSRLFPPADGPLSTAEQAFLQRSQALWQELDLLYATATEAQPAQPSRPFLRGSSRSASADSASAVASAPTEPSRSGWYVWYVDQRLQLLYWRTDASQRVWGYALTPERLLADLIGQLPASDNTLTYQAKLSDARGRTLYQWGRSDAEPAATDPGLRRALSHPLGSWQLQLTSTVATEGSGWWRWQWFAWLGLAALAVIGLGLYLGRAQQRELQLAAQRVSFVNQVSHELKTPLTNIRMYAELLQQRLEAAEPPLPRYLSVVIGETERLSRLIANVLSFGRAGRGQLTVSPRPVVPDAIITDVLERYRPVLDERGIVIQFEAGAAEPVTLDPDALEQVLNNLLGNIEKYAAAGGRAELSSVMDASQLRIQIRDHGPGIPRNERERVFEAFYRLSNSVTDGVTGTGIGLGLARELCRLHGGDLVLLDSAAGALFEIRLPVTPAASQEPPA